MTTAQSNALRRFWIRYGLEVGDGEIDSMKLFGNRQPLVLEVGFGMGDSFLEQVLSEAGTNFIGVEMHRPGIGHLLNLAAAADLGNLRIYRSDINEVMERCVPIQSVARIQVFFPDPWPKRRHHKRRLINHDFLNRVLRILEPGGVLHVATDWPDYGESIAREVWQTGGFEETQAGPRTLTKYEQRGRSLGHVVQDLAYRK